MITGMMQQFGLPSFMAYVITAPEEFGGGILLVLRLPHAIGRARDLC